MRTFVRQRFDWPGKGLKSGYRKITSRGRMILALILIPVLATPVTAGEDPATADPFARFGSFTEGSELLVDHRVWNTLLEATVVVLKPSARSTFSKRRQADPLREKVKSRISRSSRPAAPLESNRVLFHLLSKEHVELVAKYRQELEILPNSYPLADFNKDEQLAYWLNLHNAALFEQLARRYPISKLKTLRKGSKNKPSLWDEKLLTVEGVALSLNDIQNNILIRHWNSPLVLYGLYQGAIGGPSLSNAAFTGENVNGILESKAEEFVNSNRGVKIWRGEARVSLFYEWGKAAFPDWESDLASHLAQFTTGSREAELTSAKGSTAKLYEWGIAEIKNENLSRGRTLAAAADMVTKVGAKHVPGAYDAATVTRLRDAANQE